MAVDIMTGNDRALDCPNSPCPLAPHRTSHQSWPAIARAFAAACRDFTGFSALWVLGRRQYLRLLSVFVGSLPRIVRCRSFAPVYQAMGRHPVQVRFKGQPFLLDCPYIDGRIDFGTHSFVLIRELFIRNCYVRDAVARVFPDVRTVLDVGANRGFFSTMMAVRADKVVSVEFMPRYVDVIRRNMQVNNCHNCAIETAFVGAGGTGAECAESTATRSIGEILDRNGLPMVDLVKMDIEGSEFALFEKAEWLDRVSALCMEVHPEHGDVATIIKALASRDFDHSMRDRRLRPTADPRMAMYVYAARRRVG